MLDILLADRFTLTLHRDTGEQPIYALAVRKRGPKRCFSALHGLQHMFGAVT